MECVFIPSFFSLSVIAGVIILLFNTSQVFNFYCKLVLYYVILLAVSTICIPVSLLRPGDMENTLIAGYLFRFLCSIFGMKWEVKGKENLTLKDPCVVVCNHQSSVDVIGMMVLWPYLSRCAPMIKKELRYFSGPFGVLAALSGSIFIDRFNPEKARDTVNNTVNYLNQKKAKVWVFPEGTRNANGSMLPFKKGAFHLAVQGKLPILPIVFSSYSTCYNKKNKIFTSGNVTITVLPPIQTADLTPNDVGKLTEEVRTQMLDTFNKTSDIKTFGENMNGTK